MRVAFTSDLQLRDDRLADREETLHAFARELEARSVETLVIAGDVFHFRRPGVDELDVFRRWLGALPIDVVLVVGNHDHRGPAKPTTVELFDGERNGGPSTIVFRHPDTLLLRSTFEHPDVVLGVLPWAHPGTIAAAGFDKREQADALLKVAEGLAVDAGAKAGPPAYEDAVPVLVTHHALDGLRLPTGLAVRELMGETILDTRALLEQGWSYIFAGHIHADGVALELGRQAAYSIGVPWRHDFGEAGLEPGFLVLDSAEGTVEKVALPDRRFITIDADRSIIGGAVYYGDPIELAGAIVRVRVHAKAGDDVAVEAIRERLLELGAQDVKVVVDVERHTRARLEVEAADELEPLVALEGWIEANFAEIPGETAEALRRLTRELLEAIR